MTAEHTSENILYLLLAAKRAGESIIEVYTTNFDIQYKRDNSPLTIADKRSHQIIADLLSTSPLNHFPVLSEEGRDIPYEERKYWEYFWLVDPLDGTKEFINRNGEFTVNIALIHKDRPVLGIIYVPVKDTFYFGAEGIGAYKLERGNILISAGVDGKDLDQDLFNEVINKSQNLSTPFNHKAIKFTVIGSRSHMSKETEDYIDKLREKHGEVDFISAGSSLKFCLIAEGRADLYPRFGPTMEWDTAAGQVIVEQAGGKVLNIENNEPLKYNKENLLNPYFVANSFL